MRITRYTPTSPRPYYYRQERDPHTVWLIRRTIVLSAAFLLVGIIGYCQMEPQPAIIDMKTGYVTPADFQKVTYLSEKYKLKGYFWILDQASGKVEYFKGGKWIKK